ncbi:GntR family transcriptional regulator [Kordiimonas sp.]|uniref:GntR family transcriptional regulator n=1 Tax=Kordiimonas sp. TaxID=1970157 RepID=UPI003B515D76
MAGTQKLARKSLAVQVADALREMILRGEFEQGEQLRQDDIAQRLGVSRIPLREAYQQLEAEGLVVNVPYKGTIVSRLSTDEITEYFDIRATLEAELLASAIDHLDEDVISKARKLAERMNTSNPSRRGELNWQMHEVIYTEANRPITLEMVKKIHDNLDRYVRIQLSLSEGNRDRANEEHERLITLCEQRRKNEAVGLLKDHINGARDDLVAYLRDHDK